MSDDLEAVMFDAGGVLWDLRPTHKELFLRVFSSLGESVDEARLVQAMRHADLATDRAFSKVQGKEETAFWIDYDKMVLDEIGSSLDSTSFSRELSSEFMKHAMKTESWALYPDAVPALTRVRDRGLIVGLISNATELARRVLANLDLERHFDFIIISDEVGVRKPDRRIFEMALEKAGSAAHRSLFLGDRPSIDIDGAVNAGMKAILVDRNDTFPDLGYVRISSLDELAKYL